MKVSEVLRQLRADGWVRVKSKSGHHQFKHPTKPGRVTVAGKPATPSRRGRSRVSASRLGGMIDGDRR